MSSKATTRSDEQLVGDTLNGNNESFAELVARYQRTIFNLMYRTCRSEHEAADMTQEVFLRVYERLGLFDGKRRFFPWLYTLAYNKARDWRKGNSVKLRKLAELQWDVDYQAKSHSPEKIFSNQEETVRLYDALDTLPMMSREMLLLRYRQEMTMKELASAFGLSESGAKMRISRAMGLLKSVLGGIQHDIDTRQ